MKTGTMTAPGAEIHYEVRGSGPAVLLVNGGDGDAAMFGPLAALLAEDHTVITYDLRGNSRSRLTGPPAEQRIEEHGHDAHLLLTEVAADEPAYVFGTSYGGRGGAAPGVRGLLRASEAAAYLFGTLMILPFLSIVWVSQ
ncbi:alpha/beta fold hydrolase [Streptomyces sp. NPDC002446]